jgi:hypothetical protein
MNEARYTPAISRVQSGTGPEDVGRHGEKSDLARAQLYGKGPVLGASFSTIPSQRTCMR